MGGTGTLTISAANTFTGGLVLDGGTLVLDFTAGNAPTSNIISSGNNITFGFASSAISADSNTLEILGKANTNNVENFNSTSGTVTLGSGAGNLNIVPGAGGTVTVNLGTFGSSYSPSNTLDIIEPAGAVVTTSSVATSLLTNVYIDGTYMAQINAAGDIVPFTNYTTSTSASISGCLCDQQRCLCNRAQYHRLVHPHPISPIWSSTRPQNTNITLGSTVAYTFNNTILMTPNVGANTSTITGTYATGTTPSDSRIGDNTRNLILANYDTQGTLVIATNISDTGGGNGGGVVKVGGGTVDLTQMNTYTSGTAGSGTAINEGKLVVTGGYLAPSISSATFANTGVSTFTLANPSDITTYGLFVGELLASSNIGTASGGGNQEITLDQYDDGCNHLW